MATLGTIVADFTTSLASAIAVGGTTGTLQSATDDDGVALPSGRYFFTIDGANANKEHISCQLSGTSLSSIKSVSRQGVETTGTARAHRLGATVTITDYLSIKLLNDMISGAATLDADVPLGYDATASITTDNQLATKAYVDGVAISGAPDAATGTKGITKLSVAAASAANPIAVGDNDPRIAPNNYGASAAGTDTYAITLSSAPSAYATGQVYTFKADVANTGAATLNVNSLGAKTIKKNVTEDLVTGDILVNQVVTVTYDGTNMQLQRPATPAPELRKYLLADSPATWTKPVGLTAVIVEVVGGGGGGGGSTTSDRGGSGGGGGGYSRKRILASALGSTETVTVGAGGTGGTSGFTAGGTSSFGTHLQATGGGAGSSGGSTVSAGGAGGVGSSGDVNAVGGTGSGGQGDSSTANFGGGGGGSVLGGATAQKLAGVGGSVSGDAGNLYGGGGGGGSNGNGADESGGAGAPGIVIVTEYYS